MHAIDIKVMKGKASKKGQKKASDGYIYSDLDTEDDGDCGSNTQASAAVVKENDGKDKPKAPVTLQKVVVRSVTACAFMALYLGLLRMGHLYCIVSVMIVQAELYREFVNVRYVEAKERQMPWFRSLQWMWFVMGMTYVCKSFDI